MKAKLVVVGGEAKAGEVDLKLPATVGRGREASLTLPHPLVSREHCEIYESNGRLFVRDLGSLNGTFINNQRIEGEAELPVGDLLTIGTVTFRAEYEDQPDTRPPAAEDNKKTSPASGAVAAAAPARVDDDSTQEAPTPPQQEDILADDEFDGFSDLDFDEIDDDLDDDEMAQTMENGPASTVPLAQPLPEPTAPNAETQPLPEPTPPVPLVPPAEPLAPAGQAAPPANLAAPGQPVSLPDPAPPAPQVPAAETPSMPVAEPQQDSDAEEGDDDLNTFLKGLN